MRSHAVLAATLLLVGCNMIQRRVSAEGEDWKAELASQTGSTIRGTVDARSGRTGTTATIRIEGAATGARHPWHIHRGQCGSNGPIVGPAAAYPLLVVGGDGRATATATIDVDIGVGDDDNYYVNVHASPQNMGTIIACGRLDD